MWEKYSCYLRTRESLASLASIPIQLRIKSCTILYTIFHKCNASIGLQNNRDEVEET